MIKYSKGDRMETLELILKRRSVREYLDKEISDSDIEKILRAGLSSPSACNKMPWHFIVVKNKELIHKMSIANGKAGIPLYNAPVAILVCMDKNKELEHAREYSIIDCAIAEENMVLAAASLGIGSCYFGTWPQEDKIKNQKEIFNLDENLVPHMILSFGYSKDKLFKDENKKINLEDVEFR